MELPVPNCSMQHQNPVGDFDDTGHFLQGALGHNKWICGSESCMYVWKRLHVHGRRIPGRARRMRKFTDSYPFIKKIVFYREILGLFDDLVESTLLAGGK